MVGAARHRKPNALPLERCSRTYSCTLPEPTHGALLRGDGAICPSPVSRRVRSRGVAGGGRVAVPDARAGGRVAHQDPEGPGPRLAAPAADAALQGVVEAAAEQGGAPAPARCARGPDPAAAVEHLESLRARIAARVRMQRDEERRSVAGHCDALVDRDEGVVGAGQQHVDGEPRREPARDHLGHLEHDVLLEHAADAPGAGGGEGGAGGGAGGSIAAAGGAGAGAGAGGSIPAAGCADISRSSVIVSSAWRSAKGTDRSRSMTTRTVVGSNCAARTRSTGPAPVITWGSAAPSAAPPRSM